MKRIFALLRGIWTKVLGKKKVTVDNNMRKEFRVTKITTHVTDSIQLLQKREEPYFVQIGLDFGTSYSKCICRDIIKNMAWVHIPPKFRDQEFPFLIPSVLVFDNNEISHPEESNINYPEGGIYHLKNALVLAAKKQLNEPLFAFYKRIINPTKDDQLYELVKTVCVYFLAGILGEVRSEIRKRFPDFGSMANDYMAVNLSIPVENAQQPEVNKLFKQLLKESWQLADQLSGHPCIHLKELISLRKNLQTNEDEALEETCFIYPEVSANVQDLFRSRVSSPGIYLFNDTGGGSIDQSIFIFVRQDYKELLTYLVGRVLPLGSSKIEERVTRKLGKKDWMTLEQWRKRKERGENHKELLEARHWIFRKLVCETERTLALAMRKLYVEEQMNDIRLIFSGGGHCQYPYKDGVLEPFSGRLFQTPLCPDIIGMPTPKDLQLKGGETRWTKRLSVAYGLSFEKSELARFILPVDVATPAPNEIWQRKVKELTAPTKDQC